MIGGFLRKKKIACQWTQLRLPQNSYCSSNKWKIVDDVLTPEDEASFDQSSLVVEKLKKKIAELPPETVEKRKSFLSMASRVDEDKYVIHFGLVKEFSAMRWYETVTVEEVLEAETPTWTIHLDGYPLVSREKKGLFMTYEQAVLVASEWEAQDVYISVTKMPMMSELCGAIDDHANFRKYHTMEIIQEYLNADSLCYDLPQDHIIYDLQQSLFRPVLQWFREEVGLVMHSSPDFFQYHPQETSDCFEMFLDSMDPVSMIIFSKLCNYCKSIILPLALWHGAFSVTEGLAIVRFEEDYQEKMHGSVPAGQDYHGTIDCIDLATCTLLLQSSGARPLSKELIESFGDYKVYIMEKRLKALEEKQEDHAGFARAVGRVHERMEKEEPGYVSVVSRPELKMAFEKKASDMQPEIDDLKRSIELRKVEYAKAQEEKLAKKNLE